MGKWLSNLVTPILLLFASSILSAALKGPIDEWANENRLKAQVQLAPWIDKLSPDEKAGNATGAKSRLTLSRLTQFSESLGVARVFLKNESSSNLTNISFELPNIQSDEAVLLSKDGRMSLMADPDKISIPDMKPGDSFTVIIWGSFVPGMVSSDFKSYSSQGHFRTSFDWPTRQDETYEKSDIFDLLDSFAWIAGLISGILLIIICGIAWAQHWEYIKLIFTYPKAYEIEKKRFWSDPRKFKPDWALLNEKHYIPHAILGEPCAEAEECANPG